MPDVAHDQAPATPLDGSKEQSGQDHNLNMDVDVRHPDSSSSNGPSNGMDIDRIQKGLFVSILDMNEFYLTNLNLKRKVLKSVINKEVNIVTGNLEIMKENIKMKWNHLKDPAKMETNLEKEMKNILNMVKWMIKRQDDNKMFYAVEGQINEIKKREIAERKHEAGRG